MTDTIENFSVHAVCEVPVCPIRATPAHRSEMVSQLIFGEGCKIIEDNGEGWCKIECDYDGYEGWCQRSQLSGSEEENVFHQFPPVLTRQWSTKIIFNGADMIIPFGSVMAADLEDRTAYQNNAYEWDPLGAKLTETQIRQIAFTFVNTSYLWGGKSVFGVDCSGFVQTVFRFFNIPILRDASQQATEGEGVGFLQEARCGDLAFFDNNEGRITHVGLLLNDHEIIHASVKVRVDNIDNHGIVNRETGERTHKLRLIKRYFELLSQS